MIGSAVQLWILLLHGTTCTEHSVLLCNEFGKPAHSVPHLFPVHLFAYEAVDLA